MSEYDEDAVFLEDMYDAIRTTLSALIVDDKKEVTETLESIRRGLISEFNEWKSERRINNRL